MNVAALNGLAPASAAAKAAAPIRTVRSDRVEGIGPSLSATSRP
jgi:hypothetical protein